MSPNSAWRSLLFLMLTAVLLAVPVCAQQTNLSETSYVRASAVLEAGRKALGVTGVLPGFEDISFKVTGNLYARNQSPLPGAAAALPIDGDLTVDFAKDRILWEVKTEFPGGFPVWNRLIIKGDKSTVVLPLSKNVGPVPNPQLRDILRSRVPQLLLALAVERAATLRWIGETEFNGRKQNVVAFATANGTQTFLYFDAGTSLLTKSETLAGDPVAGDAITENIVAGYKDVGGMQLPTGQVQKIAGELSQEYVYSNFRLNTHLEDARYETPKDYAPLPAPPTGPPAVRELGKDVYYVEGMGGGIYAVLFVVFNDHVMLIEPVLNEATTRMVTAIVKEKAPNKPIRYVVATHHHSDHIGGVRTYIADGVTLVTTPGNVEYFRKMAAARFTLPPDALQLQPRAPVIETIQNKKRVFSDGTQVVELYDVGPNPHVREFVVAWLPKERILFGGDIFGRDPDGSILPANAATIQVSEALTRLGLPVEKLVDVHSFVNTAEDLQKSLEMSKKAS